MDKAKNITLSLDFPEGQESPGTAGTIKELRLRIFRALGQLMDTGESELQIPTNVATKIHTIFAGTPFEIEEIEGKLVIKKRGDGVKENKGELVVATTNSQGERETDCDDESGVPDYVTTREEWAKFARLKRSHLSRH